jgi:hypothetical protein
MELFPAAVAMKSLARGQTALARESTLSQLMAMKQAVLAGFGGFKSRTQ